MTSSIGSSPRVAESAVVASRLRLCRLIKSHEESTATAGRLQRRHRHWSSSAPPLDPPFSREACRCFQFDWAMHAAAAVPIRSRLDLLARLGSAVRRLGSAVRRLDSTVCRLGSVVSRIRSLW
jgi:hypothetical protein